MDSTIVKVHPDGTGALKKRPPIHRPLPRRVDHQDSYGCRECSNRHHVLALARKGPRRSGRTQAAESSWSAAHSLIMDRAYERNKTRQLALALGYEPVVPPLRTRVEPWEYDREMYKRRNEIERLFRRLKGFRRIFSRFEKLDAVFLGFILFALVDDALR